MYEEQRPPEEPHPDEPRDDSVPTLDEGDVPGPEVPEADEEGAPADD
jgi:hypothetical protein